jgi:hypothetical protein
MNKVYAGIGSRDTPDQILKVMTDAAGQLSKDGWLLRSGHARGADQAFENGAGDKAEIHLPWDGYNYGRIVNPKFIVPKIEPALVDIASRWHPKWEKLPVEEKLFMVRNTSIVLGTNLLHPVRMVVCWTPRGLLKGGTAHAIKVAQAYDIPVFNLANSEDWDKLTAFVEEIENATSIPETA